MTHGGKKKSRKRSSRDAETAKMLALVSWHQGCRIAGAYVRQ